MLRSEFVNVLLGLLSDDELSEELDVQDEDGIYQSKVIGVERVNGDIWIIVETQEQEVNIEQTREIDRLRALLYKTLIMWEDQQATPGPKAIESIRQEMN